MGRSRLARYAYIVKKPFDPSLFEAPYGRGLGQDGAYSMF